MEGGLLLKSLLVYILLQIYMGHAWWSKNVFGAEGYERIGWFTVSGAFDSKRLVDSCGKP